MPSLLEVLEGCMGEHEKISSSEGRKSGAWSEVMSASGGDPAY